MRWVCLCLLHYLLLIFYYGKFWAKPIELVFIITITIIYNEAVAWLFTKSYLFITSRKEPNLKLSVLGAWNVIGWTIRLPNLPCFHISFVLNLLFHVNTQWSFVSTDLILILSPTYDFFFPSSFAYIMNFFFLTTAGHILPELSYVVFSFFLSFPPFFLIRSCKLF